MDAAGLVRLRLRRQQLREPHAASPEDALRSLLAVQSQEFAYARWSLAQRTNQTDVAATAADVEAAVSDGRILRTHVLRPTWHFVHRDDLAWLLPLSAPRLHQINRGMYRQTGIDGPAAERGDAVLQAAVAGGAHKTREELAAVLQEAGFAGKGLQFVYLIMHAEINGLLVSGPPVRSAGGALKQTYASFAERVPAATVEPNVALAELTARYFASRGPATIKDCATWSGLTMRDVRLGLAMAAEMFPGRLSTVKIDGVDFHLAGEAAMGHDGGTDPAAADGTAASRPGDGPGPRIDLIQCYDEYVMGYSETRHYLGGLAPVFQTAEQPMHVVLLDGRLAGWWRHAFVRGGCELDIKMLVPVDIDLDAALDSAAQRYGSFLGMPVERTGSLPDSGNQLPPD